MKTLLVFAEKMGRSCFDIYSLFAERNEMSEDVQKLHVVGTG
jgi:hypothetical protein